MKKIKVGIYGYGNLGKGVELALTNAPDMELKGIFTRRDPASLKTVFSNSPVFSINDAPKMKDDIDVMILCGGSATDLPVQGPEISSMFNTIDSFDTHAKVPEYFKNVDTAAKKANTLALISCGWDPGLFSLNRCLLESVLPDGENYVFYGRGLSQGHSDAVRRLNGVKNAVQYTVPYDEAVQKVRNGENPKFDSVREVMWRECFVVLEDGADPKKVEKDIKEMPNYFEPYNTVVHFISEAELKENHLGMPHGGFVLRSGKTSKNTNQVAEFSLKLDSNPEFTASVLVAYARAIAKMHESGNTGAITVLDVPISMLTNKSRDELLKNIL
ncbi:MAG: diaminopimelate dehydrogenase [Clostridia bacterium]|nr:diaminopimelate dehydrogenase [Clostridia bacterium]